MAVGPLMAGPTTARAATVNNCSTGAGACSPQAGAENALQVTLPDGAQPCPSSGMGASCLTSDGTADLAPGTASTPDGAQPCPSSSALSTPAACSDPTSAVAPATNPSVEPSVPVATIRPAPAVPTLTLASSAPATVSGGSVVLTANAAAGAIKGGGALEIFDTTTSTLVGSCSQGTECSVGYSAGAGVHRFKAYVVGSPTGSVPDGSATASDAVSVGWLGVTLASTQAAVGPGKIATLTATSTVPVDQFGYSIQLLDADTNTPITFCSRGTNCSVSVSEPASGSRAFVAHVGPATSDPLSVTWLSVGLTGSSTYQAGGIIHLDATTNVDLTNTPWSLGILDASGHLVAAPCKAASCSADVAMTSASTPQFTAVVGAVPAARTEAKVLQLVQKLSGPTTLVNVQAQSTAMQPTRLLWGVDSCKAFTGDPTGEIFPGVASSVGTPDFWGRYLTTTVCPAISSAEVALAHDQHMAILPIYNDFDCSNVAGYDTATGYAQAAIAAAQALSIPKGRVLAIDIEPSGPYCSGAVDADFVRGWFDTITTAGYVPVYYGNGTSGSEFATAWCQAQSQQAQIATGSFIWSFEPSLEDGGWSKSNAPGWSPYDTGCPDAVAAWQYQIDVNSPNPNIDSDEALATLPLWYP
ncbi:MAG TPA: glycoside hydrolase domain-containing protein [Candidatus Dormibacteraeota bacterium]|nr:glycoside hydrolase domain-containing protein [Candidatus Dormibacteraeota bacterium]